MDGIRKQPLVSEELDRHLVVKQKPRAILDTNVAGIIATNPRIGSDIRRQFSVAVSPVSLMEVLHCLKGARSDDDFRADQRRLRGLVGPKLSTVVFLRWPGDFALRTVIGKGHSLNTDIPSEFKKAAEITLRAESLEQLMSKRVPIGRGRYAGLNLHKIQWEQQRASKFHRDWLSKEVPTGKPFGTQQQFAYLLAHSLGMSISTEQADELGQRLEAVYLYQRTVFEIVRGNPNYNTEKHDSDWEDCQQLLYLCDPRMHLITADNGIRQRVKNSGQADRIISVLSL